MKDRILLLGDFGSAAATLEEEVHATGLQPVSARDPEGAFRILAADPVFAIVYAAGSAPVETVCTTVRGNPRFDRVPLIAAVRDVEGEVLGPIFSSGADDWLPLGERGHLEDKLRELQAAVGGRPSFTKARAVLADPERQRRVQFARVLRQASYDVHFALDSDEVMRVLRHDETVQLVVADAELPPSGCLPLLETTRKQGRDRPIWIVSGSAAQRAAIEGKLGPLGNAAYHDHKGPPENLLFTVNAVSMAPVVSQRSSQRILHGTAVSFQVEGSGAPSIWGSTFNVSRDGLYLRTLTPAPFGAVLRLRLEVPGGGARVDLRAKVVWRKELGAEKGVPGPAGMGLQLADCDPAQRRAYEDAYDRLVRQGKGAEKAA